ncbi:MAG: hypothetical protein KGJ43_06400 [Acidobacteriota bacterium]|nr:hypothetical protein [Acidobacteriota bacterium]
MPEIRIDPLSGQRVILAADRAGRPGGGPACAPPAPIDRDADPFAPGHEERTPPELHAVRPAGGEPDGPGWSVRVVPNLYPALTPPEGSADATAATATATGPARGQSPHSAHLDLFSAMPATGAHEVIVNAPDSVTSLADLPLEQVCACMAVWRERIAVHGDSAYVQLIVNERLEAGASLPHTHAQLYAFGFVPADIARERERFGAHYNRTQGQNLLGDLIAEEVRIGDRLVALDDEAVLIAPYASRVPYQLMLAPRTPRARFEEPGPLCAALLHDGLRRLARLLGASPPLNIFLRNAPAGAEHFCWHIDVMPRLTHLAGLELSTGLALNIVAPEHAAAMLREA